MVKSSYNINELSYQDLFKTICQIHKPKRIIEFGILDGFSLKIFADNTKKDTIIEAYDIFKKFNGNSASKTIINKFSSYPNLKIKEGDFYTKYKSFELNSIDLLHIDIANNGYVYQFTINHYLPLISKNGLIILEGGSKERDNVEWMIKYNKPSIVNIIEKIKINNPELNINVIGKYPSVTIITK